MCEDFKLAEDKLLPEHKDKLKKYIDFLIEIVESLEKRNNL